MESEEKYRESKSQTRGKKSTETFLHGHNHC